MLQQSGNRPSRIMKTLTSHLSEARQKAQRLLDRKGQGKPIAMFTAYDFPTAKILESAGADALLVGDSVGMVVMGYPDTTHVTLEDIIHHTRMVARAKTQCLVIADMPIHTYDDEAQSLETAWKLVEAGADAVKLEGGAVKQHLIRAIREAGIPVVGHIGLLPQNVLIEGGYKIKGKTDQEAEGLKKDIVGVSEAGACLIVIEGTIPAVSSQLTQLTQVPTIGIGSGDGTCDGAVVVISDLVGAYPWFVPSFVKPKIQLAQMVEEMAKEWISELRSPSSL